MEERFETFTLLITSISRSIRRLKTEETAHLERLKKLEKKMKKGVDKEGGRW